MPKTAMVVSLLSALVCFTAACLAIAWAWRASSVGRARLRRLRDLERRLDTYRQWTGDHIFVAFPDAFDQEK
jgi:hypothetical protein